MPLPSSGQISMSQINTELGRSSTAQISLDAAENGAYGGINVNSASRPNSSNPAAMSEWYGYNHNASGGGGGGGDVPSGCIQHLTTATGFFTWKDCSENYNENFLEIDTIVCAQQGSMTGSYIELESQCGTP